MYCGNQPSRTISTTWTTGLYSTELAHVGGHVVEGVEECGDPEQGTQERPTQTVDHVGQTAQHAQQESERRAQRGRESDPEHDAQEAVDLRQLPAQERRAAHDHGRTRR